MTLRRGLHAVPTGKSTALVPRFPFVELQILVALAQQSQNLLRGCRIPAYLSAEEPGEGVELAALLAAGIGQVLTSPAAEVSTPFPYPKDRV